MAEDIGCLEVLIALALAPVAWYIEAAVAVQVWEWHLTQVVGFTPTIMQAFIVSLLAGLVLPNGMSNAIRLAEIQRDMDLKPNPLSGITASIFISVFVLFVGWVLV